MASVIRIAIGCFDVESIERLRLSRGNGHTRIIYGGQCGCRWGIRHIIGTVTRHTRHVTMATVKQAVGRRMVNGDDVRMASRYHIAIDRRESLEYNILALSTV